MDWIITGASRGIGRALTVALVARASEGDRVLVLARDAARLAELRHTLESPRCAVIPLAVDLARPGEAAAAGERLAGQLSAGATLVHNAGLWPSRRVVVDGLESAFAIHCMGPLALQAPLLEAGLLSRVLVVSAGLLIKGRFDPERTLTGADFSGFRTYCTTKLAGAVVMRDVARRHPAVDFAIIHPGVVATDLGARRGPLGWLLQLVKRRWESPETCAARLLRVLDRPRWETTPGEAPWYHEDSPQPWPAVVDEQEAAVLSTVAPLR